MDGETLKKHVMNVAMLPEKAEWRTQIVEWIAMKYLEKYGDGIICDRWYLNQRKEVLEILKSIVLDRKYKGKENVFMSMLYLLKWEEQNEINQ